MKGRNIGDQIVAGVPYKAFSALLRIELTKPAASGFEVAHGLPAVPNRIECYARAINANNGYVVGARISPDGFFYLAGAPGYIGMGFWTNATTLGFNVDGYSTNCLPHVIKKTFGNSPGTFFINSPDWAFGVRACVD